MRWGGRWRAAIAIGLVGLSVLGAQPAAAGPVEDFQGSWVDRALELQYALGGDVPLLNAPWIGTHNSFNSGAEMGNTLSAQDSNQKITIHDQLEIDIRSLELDVHRFPSAGGGGFAPVVCHARGGDQAHFGCSAEKTLGPVLDGIASWLRRPQNRDQVLLLYLEDHLDNEEGYDSAAAAVDQSLGDLLYRPPAGACTELPYEISRDAILATGAQAIIVSDCGVGSGWPSVVFKWDEHEEERPFGYRDFPDCGPDFTLAVYQSKLVRYFEDTTRLTGTVGTPDDGITPQTAAAMARCGVDLIGLDQLRPTDGRLEALVWSWAVGQPSRGRCAFQGRGRQALRARWHSRSCAKRRRPACRTDAGAWKLGPRFVRATAGRGACRAIGAGYAVPRTGFEAQLLRQAMAKAGVKQAWLGYRLLAGGRWLALDRR